MTWSAGRRSSPTGGAGARTTNWGALNLITAASRRAAAGLIREGHPVSMALEMDPVEAVDNAIPFVQEFYRVGGDEWTIHFHGAGHARGFARAHLR